MKKIASFISLFASTGTLLCCALPALFVTLGMGAAFAGLTSSFPQLIWLSSHKTGLFIFAAVMLVLSGYLQFRARDLDCPIDPKLAEACKQTRGWSFWIYWISVGIFLIGAFFAFIAPSLL